MVHSAEPPAAVAVAAVIVIVVVVVQWESGIVIVGAEAGALTIIFARSVAVIVFAIVPARVRVVVIAAIVVVMVVVGIVDLLLGCVDLVNLLHRAERWLCMGRCNKDQAPSGVRVQGGRDLRRTPTINGRLMTRFQMSSALCVLTKLPGAALVAHPPSSLLLLWCEVVVVGGRHGSVLRWLSCCGWWVMQLGSAWAACPLLSALSASCWLWLAVHVAQSCANYQLLPLLAGHAAWVCVSTVPPVVVAITVVAA